MTDPYDPKPIARTIFNCFEDMAKSEVAYDFKTIVGEVKEFLRPKKQDELRFGAPVRISIDNKFEDEGLFDPIHNLKIDDGLRLAIDGITRMYLEDERLLLDRAQWSPSAYNTALYGISLKIEGGEILSQPLQDFLIKHLLNPSPPQLKNSVGMQPLTLRRKLQKYTAILIAKQKGLKYSRNEASVRQLSACDAVAQAAAELSSDGYEKIFKRGYNYKTLKSLYEEFNGNSNK